MTAQTKKAASGKTITIIQTGSKYGRKPGMRETLTGLGLGRRHAQSQLVDTPEVRGMITKVRHLIRVEEGK
jgi:large subunit ribosomal protein L30